MKKAKTIGKKTLSVFLAMLMVLTAWVWVAPTEASAVNSSGNYTWRLYINCTNAYTGNAGYYTVTGKTNNGQGTDTTISNQTTLAVGSNSIFDKGTSAYFPSSDGTTTTAFPYKVYIHTYKNSGFDFWPGMTDGSYSAELQVKDSSGSWKTICSGDSGVTNGHGNVDLTISHATNNYPSPNSIKWETENAADTADLTIGKTANVTRTMKFNVYDQYGVRMSSAALTALNKAPTATVTASQSGTLGTNTSSNIYYTLSSTNTDAYYITVTAKPGAKSTTYDSQTITISASCNSKSLTNRTFTLYDPMYKFTMNPNGGGMISPTTDIEKRYHNTFGYTPNASRTGFTLIGFYTTDYDDSYEDSEVSSSDSKLTSTTYIDGDLTWYAAWQANQYKMKFTYRDENGSWITTDEVTEYFGRDIPFPEVKSVIETVDHTYTFTGWSPAHTTVQAVDGVTEYTAVYSDVTHYADLTALEEQIRLANEKKAEQLYTEGAYTDSTVEIFEDTLELAENLVGRKPLLSEQSTVDGLANTLKTARENLDIKNYTVIFVDEDGTILKDGYFFVSHGSAVTIPANPEKEADETNHYTFSSWDSEESDSLDACNYVTNNLIYVASFNAEAHTFTETVTPSTCTTDGVITKTCDCGFSYTVAGDTAGHKWSTDYKEIVPATCATKGAEAKYCTVCDAIDESTKREIVALGHNFGAYTEYTPATCFGEGTEISICSRCNGKDVRKTNKLVHQFGAAVVVPKTCTTDGYTQEVCNTCGFTNIRDIDIAKGHSLKIETSAETCVSSGYAKTFCEICDFEKTTVYPATGVHTYPDTWEKVSEATCVGHGVEKRVCTVCGAATETRLTALAAHTEPADWTVEVDPWCDSEGRQVKDCTVCGKELKSEAIPALSHDYEAYAEGSYPSTCTSAGAEAEKCSRCGDVNITVIQPLGHDWDAGVRTEATCTSGGYITYSCERADCTETKIELINGSTALPHNFDETIEANVTIVADATCESDGHKTVKCANCNATTTVIIQKLGHTWGEWVVTKEATNNEDGEMQRTCSNNTCTETVKIPKGGHEWDDGTVTETATCTTTGKMVYVCTKHENCGITIEVTVPMTQHTIDQRVTEATCTTQGKVEAYCTVCNKVFSEKSTPVKAHSFDSGTEVDATCTTSGYTLYECTVDGCGFSYKEYDETKPATGHDFDETITENVTTEAATCTADGSKTVKCKNCSETKTETISKFGHNYVEQGETTATCKNAGTKEYKCEYCGDTYITFVEEAKDHQWSETWTVVREATDDEPGVEKTTCTVCKEEKYRTTEPIGDHSFTEEITTQATCITDGLKTFTCTKHTDCSANYAEIIPATGHTEKIEYTAPTCIAEGSSKIVCGVCDHEIASESIPMIYHDFSGEGVKVDATCTAEGSITYTCTTDGCEATKTEKIPAKGHTLTTTVVDATCGEKGSVVTECKVCNDPTVKKVTELAAKGHIWNDTPEVTPADCENNGKEVYTCVNCDETKEVIIPALGHTWGEWVVTPSTNNDKGSVSRECSVCSEKESVDIPAGGHNLVVDTANSTDASCTENGETVYKCDAHTGENDCGISVTVTVPAKGHKVVVETTEAKCEEDGSVVEKCDTCDVIIKTTKIPAKGHTITVTTTPATCTSEGSVVEDCDDCDYTKTTKIVKLQHDFSGTETTVKNATCTEDGEKTVQCKTCEETTTVIIPKLGHKWGAWVKVDATNDTDGSWTRICENNPDHKEVVEIPAGGHNLVEDVDQYKAPKCNEKGQRVYVCNNPAHTDCSVTVTVELDYAQHTVAQREIEASCTTKGSVEAYCSDCNLVLSTEEIPVKSHEYTAGTPVDATCTTSGYTPYTCSCGDTYNKYDNSKPATGHTLVESDSTATCENEGTITLSCEDCSYTRDVKVPALGHNYVENTAKATAATCAAAATKTYECSCGVSYTISVGDKLTGDNVHNFGAWTVKESATASSLGYETRTCNVCGKVEVRTIPATGTHNFTILVPEESKDPTCTEVGYETKRCSSHENCTEKSMVELPATGHTEKHEYQKATCTAEGYSRMICTVCEEVLSAEMIPALGHDWNDGNVTNATCNTEGKIVRTCGRTGCAETYITIIDTNPNAHQYETIVTDSTCTTVGSVITKCKLCGDEIPVKTLPVLEHSWNGGEIKDGDEATCEKAGTKTYTCTADNCTATKTEIISKLGHDWGEWTVTQASTNTATGTLTRECSRGCTETADIPAGGHNLVETSRDDASCTEEGSVTYTCNTVHEGNIACGISVTVTLAKTQHELEMKTEKRATCDVAGSVVTKCKNCDTVTLTTTIPATGHAWNEGVVTEAASCTKEGTMTYTCAHNAEHKYTAKIAMVQHKYIAGIPVAPTCTSSGYTPYKCENCESSYVILGDAAKGHTFLKDTSTADCENGGTMTLKCACGVTMTTDVPALGHDYKLQSTTPASCAATATETYKCSRCEANYTVSVGAKTEDHDFGDWVVVKKADYDSIGYETRTCKICGKLEVETIDAIGSHKLVETKRDEPTCTADGKIYYACGTHTDCGITDEVVIPKLGHIEELRYTAASCTSTGSTSIYCTRCQTTISAVIEIPVLDHAWTEGKIINSTCSDKGSIEFNCDNCAATKTVEIPENEDAHSLTKVTEPATCTKEGSVVISCTLCGDEIYTEPLPMLQHSWGNWSVKTPSTNDADGEMVRYCDNGCEDTVKIPAGGHAFGNTPDLVVEASCTATGSATYKCTAHTGENACGVEITVVLDKIQHNIVTESETATCENGGFVKVYCSVCDEVYIDMTIGKLAHSYEVIDEVKATCTTAGYTTFECKNCKEGYSRIDAQPTGHKYLNDGAVVVTNATCETAGYTTYNCDDCDETHTANIVPAKGHDWTEWTVEKEATNTETGTLSRTCKNGCGETETAEIPAGGHKFDTSKPVATTEGTCLVKGTKTFKCTEHDSCGIEITVETEFGAHDWTEWTKVDATNDKEGSWTRKCNTCGTEETLVIPAGGHNLVEDEAQYIAPKCNAKGQRVYKCDAHPGCSVTITVVLEKIQHTADVEKKDATCTEDGFVKTYCTACGEVISNVVLPATGHINTRTERKESTCIEHGYEKVICACSYIVSEKELPLIAHNYDANGDGKVDKKDAIFEDGKYTYTCQQAGCGHTLVEESDDTYNVRFFDATGKQIGETQTVKYGESATAPTVPEKAPDATYHYEFIGWDRNFSAITADLDVYPTYEKEAHYGGEPTCIDKALCAECSAPYGEPDTTKHLMATKSTPATCEADGKTVHYCTVEGCTYERTETIQKLNHNFGEWETYQNGNCTAPTIKIRRCLNYNCKHIEEKTSYGAHSWYVQPEIAPTCTTVGYSEYKYCVVCNVEIESVVIPKLDHRDNDGDGQCDYCRVTQAAPQCGCLCHSTGFMKFIYTIVRFFWMITRSTPSCSCGATHY